MSQSKKKITHDDKRAPNFSKNEEQLLIGLVEKYKNIIECKKSNALTWKDKEKEAWLKIEMEFNSKSNGDAFRSAKHLKEKFNNLKKETKRKFALEKINASKTGGGPFTPVNLTDTNLAIKDILGEQVSGLENSYDCDSQNAQLVLDSSYGSTRPSETNSTSTSIISFDKVIDENIVITFSEEEIDDPGNKENDDERLSPSTNDWTAYCSKNLKAPLPKKLVVEPKKIKGIDRRPFKNRADKANNNIISEKLDFLKLQKQKFLEEYNLKMEILNLKKQIKEKKLEVLRKM